jgi:C_GCAxxG_C_C family probable redox protein
MAKDLSPALDTDRLTGRAALTSRKKLAWRTRSLGNLLKMGHCAPAVMRTLSDISGFDGEGPVRLAAGLPGGIGDTGFECGGLTAPLIFFGLRHGLREVRDGLPAVFYRGHEYYRRFLDRNGSLLCREIRGDNYRLTHCIRAVCCSPEIAASASLHDGDGAISAGQREAYVLMYSHLEARGFHCARQVLRRLVPEIPQSPELLDAASGFLGGTLFLGLTCSAYAAGVMALGFGLREFEDSFPRVLRMIVLMKTGGNAFADPVNKFNRIMNRGKALGQWFAGEYGDTRCRSITGCDFSTAAGVKRFIDTDRAGACLAISEKVAEKVRSMLLTGN